MAAGERMIDIEELIAASSLGEIGVVELSGSTPDEIAEAIRDRCAAREAVDDLAAVLRDIPPAVRASVRHPMRELAAAIPCVPPLMVDVRRCSSRFENALQLMYGGRKPGLARSGARLLVSMRGSRASLADLADYIARLSGWLEQVLDEFWMQGLVGHDPCHGRGTAGRGREFFAGFREIVDIMLTVTRGLAVEAAVRELTKASDLLARVLDESARSGPVPEALVKARAHEVLLSAEEVRRELSGSTCVLTSSAKVVESFSWRSAELIAAVDDERAGDLLNLVLRRVDGLLPLILRDDVAFRDLSDVLAAAQHDALAADLSEAD